MTHLLEILLNIIGELLPAIVEVLTGNPGTGGTTTHKTDKANTFRKRAWDQDRSPDHQ